MSKGSAPRPFSVSNEEYANRWDAIFAKESCPACGSLDFHTCRGIKDGEPFSHKECDRCKHKWDKS